MLILQTTWILEGPLMLSYGVVDWAVKSLPLRLTGGVDLLINKRMKVVLWVFRLIHGAFALCIWIVIMMEPSRLQCTEETFLDVGPIKIAVGSTAVQIVFILASRY
ncbi:unnamed protein product [Cyclocybe aegerita]|uniref:Uncharacterized protein n=1 Tax=Cyclocybe aegerita TaxID=1973307 RepID=A0A8S0W851_CYCAE|nr:unnamed protein product [Cyclocybe aegerita]